MPLLWQVNWKRVGWIALFFLLWWTGMPAAQDPCTPGYVVGSGILLPTDHPGAFTFGLGQRTILIVPPSGVYDTRLHHLSGRKVEVVVRELRDARR